VDVVKQFLWIWILQPGRSFRSPGDGKLVRLAGISHIQGWLQVDYVRRDAFGEEFL
jgi:hypothetical protein